MRQKERKIYNNQVTKIFNRVTETVKIPKLRNNTEIKVLCIKGKVKLQTNICLISNFYQKCYQNYKEKNWKTRLIPTNKWIKLFTIKLVIQSNT